MLLSWIKLLRPQKKLQKRIYSDPVAIGPKRYHLVRTQIQLRFPPHAPPDPECEKELQNRSDFPTRSSPFLMVKCPQMQGQHPLGGLKWAGLPSLYLLPVA